MAIYIINAVGSHIISMPDNLKVGDILRFNTPTLGRQGKLIKWNIPSDITVNIKCIGASGKNINTSYLGGRGANIKGTFKLAKGQLLNVLVGNTPRSSFQQPSAGGGGASGIWIEGYANPIIISGGGGGANEKTYPSNGKDANLSNNGISSYGAGGSNGSAGINGRTASGGCGWNGAAYNGTSLQKGGIGCTRGDAYDEFEGGYGGGGHASGGGGGGGGYSGGGGGSDSSGRNTSSGGGGGSYISSEMSNVESHIESSRNHGLVEIEILSINNTNLSLKINNTLKQYDKGWVRVNGSLREIESIKVKVNGTLREV